MATTSLSRTISEEDIDELFGIADLRTFLVGEDELDPKEYFKDEDIDKLYSIAEDILSEGPRSEVSTLVRALDDQHNELQLALRMAQFDLLNEMTRKSAFNKYDIKNYVTVLFVIIHYICCIRV
jgi:hypothetical protein